MRESGPRAPQRGFRRLPIGVKLTLRYTAAIAATLSVVALFVYTEVTRRINREAKLLLEVEVRELADELRGRAGDGVWDSAVLVAVGERFDRVVRTSDPSLGVGLALIRADGEQVVRRGTLARVELPVPAVVLNGEWDAALRATNLGESHAYLAHAVPVPGGALQMVVNTERYAENVERVREVLLLGFPAAVALTAVLGYLLASWTLRPIRRITATARHISASNLTNRIPLSGSGDELDRLAETLNGMLGRIEDGMSGMRRFSSNAAHELRTPLTALSSQLEIMQERERTPDEYRKVLADARDRVAALAEIVDGMLRLARSEAGLAPEERVAVALAPVIDEVCDFFEPVAEEAGVELTRGPIPDIEVDGDASWLHQLFANLVSNALKYTPSGGQVSVEAQAGDGRVTVRVRDTGPGIPTGELERCFERFQRGAGARAGGFGLGLPIAREIARAHGGDIELEPSAEGSMFRVSLPIRGGGAA